MHIHHSSMFVLEWTAWVKNCSIPMHLSKLLKWIFSCSHSALYKLSAFIVRETQVNFLRTITFIICTALPRESRPSVVTSEQFTSHFPLKDKENRIILPCSWGKTELPPRPSEFHLAAIFPTPVFLPGESQGRGSLVGGRLWGRTESDTTEAT